MGLQCLHITQNGNLVLKELRGDTNTSNVRRQSLKFFRIARKYLLTFIKHLDTSKMLSLSNGGFSVIARGFVPF